MPKTSDNVKKGLKCCAASYADCHKECPYQPDCDGSQILKDALALIQQKEQENAEQAERIRVLEDHFRGLTQMVKQLEAENASLRSERDIAVKALISVSDKVEMVQGILDDDIFHRVEYDVYLQLRDLVDNEIMSWQYESENSDGTQEDNNAESS